MKPSWRAAGLLLGLLQACVVCGQVIEFESGGLKYQTLTKNGLTIMVADLNTTVREFAVTQVAISNGSRIAWVVKPEDFRFQAAYGASIQAASARDVVNQMIEKGGRADVIKLVSAYETSIYQLRGHKSTNGYEQRRQAALAEVSSTKIKAAAAASAIAFVSTKLTPGQSTDGAVFYPNTGRPLGPGQLSVRAAGEIFEFSFGATAP